MIELIQGDKENLEGRAVIFSKYLPDKEDNIFTGLSSADTIFAIYIAQLDNDSYNEVLSDLIENIEVDYPEEIENILKDIYENNPTDNKDSLFFGIPLIFETESELLLKNKTNDILFSGEYHNPYFCISSLEIATHFYFLKFSDQEKKNLELEKILSEIRDISLAHSPSTYNFSDKDSIGPYILTHYVGPIIDAVNYGQNTRAVELEESFKTFGIGTFFEKDIAKLCDLSKLGKSANFNLIKAYVEKINAIYYGDYRAAEKLQKKIDKMISQQE